VSIRVVGLFVLALCCLPLSALATPAVAYVDRVFPAGSRLQDAVRVERAGRPVAITGDTIDLQPGDRLFIHRRAQGEWAVTVRYIANNTVVTVHRGARTGRTDGADLTVERPALPGLTGAVYRWFKELLRGVDQGESAMTASRGPDGSGSCFNLSGNSNDPVGFSIPILRAAKSQVVAGPRALFVSWRGGAAPFQVTLAKADTDELVARQDNVRDTCSARLPKADLAPGRYVLKVADANNRREEEDSLFAVGAAPGMPPELRDAGLPGEVRDLYYATWLTSIDGGTWAFEAQQRVAAMDCRSAAVREWLSRWGEPGPCAP
jgi:hypothetical protein